MSLLDEFVQNLKVAEINELKDSTITNFTLRYHTAQQTLMKFTVISGTPPKTKEESQPT